VRRQIPSGSDIPIKMRATIKSIATIAALVGIGPKDAITITIFVPNAGERAKLRMLVPGPAGEHGSPWASDILWQLFRRF
jgi:hypothetical protein